MEATVTQTWTIRVGEAKWVVPSIYIREVRGCQFLKLVGTCYSLIRLILHDREEKLPSNPSLHGTQGWQALQDLRNKQSFPEVEPDPLFGEVAAPKKKRKKKQAGEEDEEQETIILDFAVVGKQAEVLKPKRVIDDLWVRLSGPDISAVIEYVREMGVDFSAKSKRAYKARSQ